MEKVARSSIHLPLESKQSLDTLLASMKSVLKHNLIDRTTLQLFFSDVKS